MLEEFNSETDSDFTSYWRDWVSCFYVGVEMYLLVLLRFLNVKDAMFRA